MLYHVSYLLKLLNPFFNVIHYVSFRAIAGLLSSLLFSILFGNLFIRKISGNLFRSQAREWTPDTHKLKGNMPTMGGIFIIFTVLINILLWCNLTDLKVWIFLLNIVTFGAIGFWDDWKKIKEKKGISSRTKFRLQLAMGSIISLLLMWQHIDTQVYLPFFKTLHPDIGILFIVWSTFILVGASNAVNLTDGLDGLAIGSLISNFVTFSGVCYLAGHAALTHYLHIPYSGTAEIAVIGAILVGASLGFLWFNAYPAQIFMGDVGSLALGASLALMAIMAKQELLLLISGGLFVVETLSVIAQVISFRVFGKRIFKMAPLHHHFELLGWPEAKITVRFGIISLILCLLSLITLKIR